MYSTCRMACTPLESMSRWKNRMRKTGTCSTARSRPASPTLHNRVDLTLGTYLAEIFSWRGAFVATGGLAAIALLMQALTLSPIPVTQPLKISDLVKFSLRPESRKSYMLMPLIFWTTLQPTHSLSRFYKMQT